MLENNYLIINKKAQTFDRIRFAGRTAVFISSENKPLKYGVLALNETIYAIMCCDEHRALAMVIDRDDKRTVEIIMWQSEAEYADNKKRIREITDTRISVQDYKFSNYAWQVAGKLDEGNKVQIVDAVDVREMAVCPECGMLNSKGSPYCLDCGAEID